MIEELFDKPDADRFGNVFGVIQPTKTEIIIKINEIIRKLNEMEVSNASRTTDDR